MLSWCWSLERHPHPIGQICLCHTTNIRNNPTYHQQAVVAKRVAGYGGEVVMMAHDAAAVALPSSVASHQAQVPAGGHSIWATGEPPQGDVNGRPQDTNGHAVWWKTQTEGGGMTPIWLFGTCRAVKFWLLCGALFCARIFSDFSSL